MHIHYNRFHPPGCGSGRMQFISLRSSPMHDEDQSPTSDAIERPWIALKSTYDVEAWIDSYNHTLRRHMEKAKRNASGYGICFRLSEAGRFTCTPRPRARWCLM